MRKIYNEFFYIPKHGKVREKVMLARIAMTVTVVIICLAAMSITAYAYFSHNVTSGSNIIKAANFEANVSITDSNSNAVPITKDGKIQTANLDAGKYTIELSNNRVNGTANNGFCVITIGNKTYYTDQIGVDVAKNSTEATVKFELWLSSPTKIELLSHWGTSKYYGYKDEGRPEIFIVNNYTLDLTTKTTVTKKPTVTTEPSNSTDSSNSTESNNSTESSTSTNTSIPAETEPTDTTSSTETSSTEETSSEPTTEEIKPNQE